jgi:secreted PhoX family phosphatase
VSISGAAVNCAGGPTTWGSWLTCEETTEGTAQGREKEHGYVFEVSAYADREVDAVPITAMGRFSHEAVAIDRRYGHIYETENAGNTSGFYRFIPNVRASLDRGGRLQMLAVKGKPQLDTTAGGIPPLTPMAAKWVDIDDPDPAVITEESSVFAQGLAKGGTRFARLEGC